MSEQAIRSIEKAIQDALEECDLPEGEVLPDVAWPVTTTVTYPDLQTAVRSVTL